jgi:hypothetical protein
MKLTATVLDNDVKSAVVNIGKNNGYVEVYMDHGSLVVLMYDKEGDIVRSMEETWEDK